MGENRKPAPSWQANLKSMLRYSSLLLFKPMLHSSVNGNHSGCRIRQRPHGNSTPKPSLTEVHLSLLSCRDQQTQG